jgi:ABC-type transporter Mla MlaB component
MTKDDTAQGLLSKMVKFVRNPATSWSELDSKESDRDEAVSKQLLKEMIERKRRNDFVRKREFDMLRKLRKRETLTGDDLGARPSFFQSSMASKPDDRAQTIKKIDEIEAQMSMQWWKTKHGTSGVDSSGVSSSPVAAPLVRSSARRNPPPLLTNALPSNFSPTQVDPIPSAEGSASQAAQGFLQRGKAAESSAPQPALADSGAAQARAENAGRIRPAVAAPPVLSARIPELKSATQPDSKLRASNFTHSNLMALDVSEIAHDAELEEAAIRFANGDNAGAEAGLLEMLDPAGIRVGQSETWMALFDLYRATGEQDKFELAALQFVQRFDRSAPQWFSLPEIVKSLAVPTSVQRQQGPAADWVCPSVLGVQSVATLKAAVARSPMPWRLDWSKLKTIDSSSLEPLTLLFSHWAEQSVQLRFTAESQLQNVLQSATPSGQNEVSQDWWQLRMQVQRVTHRPDEFELAALDFCVTYEVSPPSWEAGRCDYKSVDSDGQAISSHTIIGDVFKDSISSVVSGFDADSLLDAQGSQFGSNVSTIELSGQIEGDVVTALEQLETKLLGANIMVISCTNLIRVDFSAAGALLNWVSARQLENRSVQFLDVNRLIAAFFNVIGITEYARVATRRD